MKRTASLYKHLFSIQILPCSLGIVSVVGRHRQDAVFRDKEKLTTTIERRSVEAVDTSAALDSALTEVA